MREVFMYKSEEDKLSDTAQDETILLFSSSKRQAFDLS